MLVIQSPLQHWFITQHLTFEADVFLNDYNFIAIALDVSNILFAVHFSMQNICQSCDLVHAMGRSNVHVGQ